LSDVVYAITLWFWAEYYCRTVGGEL